MPRYEFTTGQVLTADQMNDLSDQTVMVFAGTAARGSAIPTPTEGMVTYRSDDDVVEVFDGSAFVGVGGGKILQVVSTSKTDTFSLTSSTFTDVTGFSATITPSAASSKIFVVYNTNMSGNDNNVRIFARLLRDSTPINVGAAAGSRRQASFGGYVNTTNGSQKYGAESVSGTILDSPNTTSAVTYKIQIAATSGAVYVNRDGEDSDSANYARTPSTMTLIEVAA